MTHFQERVLDSRIFTPQLDPEFSGTNYTAQDRTQFTTNFREHFHNPTFHLRQFTLEFYYQDKKVGWLERWLTPRGSTFSYEKKFVKTSELKIHDNSLLAKQVDINEFDYFQKSNQLWADLQEDYQNIKNGRFWTGTNPVITEFGKNLARLDRHLTFMEDHVQTKILNSPLQNGLPIQKWLEMQEWSNDVQAGFFSSDKNLWRFVNEYAQHERRFSEFITYGGVHEVFAILQNQINYEVGIGRIPQHEGDYLLEKFRNLDTKFFQDVLHAPPRSFLQYEELYHRLQHGPQGYLPATPSVYPAFLALDEKASILVKNLSGKGTLNFIDMKDVLREFKTEYQNYLEMYPFGPRFNWATFNASPSILQFIKDEVSPIEIATDVIFQGTLLDNFQGAGALFLAEGIENDNGNEDELSSSSSDTSTTISEGSLPSFSEIENLAAVSSHDLAGLNLD